MRIIPTQASAMHRFRMRASLTPRYQDASFPEEQQNYSGAQGFAGAPSHGDAFNEHEPLHLDDALRPYGAESRPRSACAMLAGHDYVPPHAGRIRRCKPSTPSTISRRRSRSGALRYPHQTEPQGFYDGDQADADFLDESQFASAARSPD